MGEIQLLDCTLRDGGYVNEWNFGHNRMLYIFKGLKEAGTDIIECGFIDERRPYDRNRTISPDTESVNRIWAKVEKNDSLVTGMIDFGTCDLSKIQPAEETFLDGIRVIFKKQNARPAFEFCKKLKELGYLVFAQLVSITSYEKEDLEEVIQLAAQCEPYALSIVDTYGLLFPKQVSEYAEKLDDGLPSGIRLGFHAHNSLQLGFANTLAFLERTTERNVIVDGTLYGIGKSAGNVPIELLSRYLNREKAKHYDISRMLEVIENSILPIYRKINWGYQEFFYMTAKEECHPNYLRFFQKKKNLSLYDQNELLADIRPAAKKLMYDEELAEGLYDSYLNEKYHDDSFYSGIRDAVAGKPILLAGPGKNIEIQKDDVTAFVEEKKPIIISINYIPKSLKPDFVFITKGSRYEEMTEALDENKEIRIIATSNVAIPREKTDFVFTVKPLLEENAMYEDISYLMLLRILKRAGIRKVYCAGLDGYSSYEDNYSNPNMEYDFVKKQAIYLNKYIQNSIAREFPDMEISYITYSHYTEVFDTNSALF